MPADPDEVARAVIAATSGSKWGWTTLVKRFDALVRGVARSHGLQPHDVEDVSQATWLRLVERIGDVRQPRAVGGWLATTAHYESLRVLRRSRRELPTDGDLAAAAHVEAVNEGRLVAAERRSVLRARVAELPKRQRQLIGMMLTEPPPDYAHIAQVLEIPHGSIGPTRQRGFARLRADKTIVATWLDESGIEAAAG